MGLSGFAGLGYQIVWTQQFGTWLGHEIVAILAVLAAFFGGLALGAYALGRRIADSARPLRWYAALEAAIGLWAFALSFLLAPAGSLLAVLIGAQPAAGWHWTVAFLGPFVLLLPATAAMGATLPAIERVSDRLQRDGFAIGGLYAANTLGAVAGVLASAFVLVPWLGLTGSAQVCAALSLMCAGGALILLPRRPRTSALAGPAKAATPTPALARAPAIGPQRSRWLAWLAITGLLGIGYEVVAVRVLSQVAENTIYTFALLLAVYLLGTAAGAAAYQRWLVRGSDPVRLSHQLLAALAAACLLGTLMLWSGTTARDFAQGLLGARLEPSFATAIATEAALAVMAFALPTVVMGALFSHLCVQAKAAGSGLGAALAANTLGAALAPVLFGVLLLPALGPKTVLALIVLGYLALLPWETWRRPTTWLPTLGAAALLAFGGPIAFVDVPQGGRLLSYRDGVTAAVSVVEDAQGVARLHIDNRQQEGSSATRLSDARQAWLPLLLHPAPKSVLFLGLGTGTTAAAASEDRSLVVDAVELLPEVIAAAGHFVPMLDVRNDERPGNLRVLAGDARRYVRATGPRYDVVISDLFHPARSGAGSLYTVEHFAAIRARLSAGGLFCQWLPLHQLDLDTLRSIVRAFLAVYPAGSAVLATHSLDTPVLGLIARPDRNGGALQARHARLAGLAQRPFLTGLNFADDFAVFGSFIAGPESLARFAAKAPLNTDDRPVVVYRAPRIAYAPDSQPRERLVSLLRELRLEPAELLGSPPDAQSERWQRRLAAYWAARTRFIEVGAAVRPSADLPTMLAQVREPLLELLRASPDFRPAYDPLFSMALALARSDVADARALLLALQAVQPARPEAGHALRQLDAGVTPAAPPP
ncbi:MAG: fused MFS/spermidine synthase [Methylibium sp.]|nr:fused MFS/spermidine synthase [Methylibium sp.]